MRPYSRGWGAASASAGLGPTSPAARGSSWPSAGRTAPRAGPRAGRADLRPGPDQPHAGRGATGAAEAGPLVITISHDAEFIRQADDVRLMDGGRLVGQRHVRGVAAVVGGVPQDAEANMTHLSTQQKAQALGASEVFASIPSPELAVLAEMMRVETLRQGETLFEAGGPSDSVFVVVSGQLSVHVGGRAEAVRALGGGDLLGEYGMFTDRTRTASIRGLTGGAAVAGLRAVPGVPAAVPAVDAGAAATAARRLVALERATEITASPQRAQDKEKTTPTSNETPG